MIKLLKEVEIKTKNTKLLEIGDVVKIKKSKIEKTYTTYQTMFDIMGLDNISAFQYNKHEKYKIIAIAKHGNGLVITVGIEDIYGHQYLFDSEALK